MSRHTPEYLQEGSSKNEHYKAVTGQDPNRPGNNGGGNGSGCFSGSTLVLSEHGWRRIDTLSGDMDILSFNLSSRDLTARRIYRRKEYQARRIWELHTDSTTSPIETTWSHPFLTHRGWVWASRLQTGDELMFIDTQSGLHVSRVASVTRTGRLETVYNLITACDHNFIIAGAVVHNYACLRLLRSTLSDILADEPRVPRWAPATF